MGIIPFKISSMVEAVNPIKLWEYLAAGIPVVTTAIPEAEKYPGLVLFSSNEKSFMENVETALYHDNPAARRQRMELARLNSWTARARQTIGIIEETLAQKGVDSQHYSPRSFPEISGKSICFNRIKVAVKEPVNIDLRAKRRK